MASTYSGSSGNVQSDVWVKKTNKQANAKTDINSLWQIVISKNKNKNRKEKIERRISP